MRQKFQVTVEVTVNEKWDVTDVDIKREILSVLEEMNCEFVEVIDSLEIK